MRVWHFCKGLWQEVQKLRLLSGRGPCLLLRDSPSTRATMTRERYWPRRVWRCSGDLETSEASRSLLIDLVWQPGDEAILDQHVSCWGRTSPSSESWVTAIVSPGRSSCMDCSIISRVNTPGPPPASRRAWRFLGSWATRGDRRLADAVGRHALCFPGQPGLDL